MTILLFPTNFVNFTSNVASVALMSARIAVIHYSSTGNVFRLATAIADGAAEEGAEVRLRRVRELAPEEAISSNPRWLAHRDAVADLPEATLDDLEWADGFAFGSPTRFGLPAAQLKQFLDQTGGLWARGLLQDKVGTAFTSASTAHGGLEATILAINTVLYHWGSIVLPLGYTDDAIKATGNPYGSSWVSRKGSVPDDDALATARHQGRRLARVAAAVRGVEP
jgi:NAD(P)H dehydrogenase (quinone)